MILQGVPDEALEALGAWTPAEVGALVVDVFKLGLPSIVVVILAIGAARAMGKWDGRLPFVPKRGA